MVYNLIHALFNQGKRKIFQWTYVTLRVDAIVLDRMPHDHTFDANLKGVGMNGETLINSDHKLQTVLSTCFNMAQSLSFTEWRE